MQERGLFAVEEVIPIRFHSSAMKNSHFALGGLYIYTEVKGKKDKNEVGRYTSSMA